MKINISNFSGNILSVMRRAGYHPEKNLSFSRPIFQERYPRFHIYYDKEKGEINLHLDQKPPKYEFAHDHGAEYDGKVVEEEAKRLEIFFQ